MRAFLFIPLTCVACSSFNAADPGTSSGSPGGEDAGMDGPTSPVTGTPSIGITLAVGDSKTKSYITQGNVLALPVTLTREPGSTGPVDITVTGLPAGVTAEALTVPAGALTATLTLHASMASVPGATAMTQVLAHEQTSGVNDIARFSAFVRGPSGSLDAAFGTGGILLPGGSGISDLQVLHDGSILATRHPFEHDVISRFTAAGVLDPSFGGAGTGTATVASAGSPSLRMSAFEGAASGTGAIYAIEFAAPSTFTLYRFHMDGTADASFSSSGRVVLDAGVGGGVLALADGTALVSSSTAPSVLTHWMADGTRDLGYGVSGSCPNGGPMLQKASGEILTLGPLDTTNHTTPLRGCTPAGLPDPAIGTAPNYTVLLGQVGAMALSDNQGLIVLDASGKSYGRYSATYVSDVSVGFNGDVTFRSPFVGSAILAQPGGAVLVGGGTSVLAFTPLGAPNSAFGTAGTATFPIVDVDGNGNDLGIATLTAYPDGRAIAVSHSGIGNDTVFRRFWE